MPPRSKGNQTTNDAPVNFAARSALATLKVAAPAGRAMLRQRPWNNEREHQPILPSPRQH